jgi:hypothetical protein
MLDEGVVVVVVVVVVVLVVVVGPPLPPPPQPTANTSRAAPPINAMVVRASDFTRNPLSRRMHRLIPRTGVNETR